MELIVTTEFRGDVGAGLERQLDTATILVAAGKALLAGVEHAYEQEGPGWAPLAESTVRERRRRGYGPRHPIQHRTGGYRRSWKGRIDGDALAIESQDFRAAILTRSGPHRPARQVQVPQADVDAAVAAAYKVVIG